MGKKEKDFQKQKLKVGKKLPKGLNVTDTSFKSKRIVVPQKAPRASPGELLTTRNRSIQDIMSKLFTCSGTTRLSALEELKELGTFQPAALSSHLKPLLETLGPICSDRTEAVRQCAHKVFQQVLNSVSKEQVTPFGPLLLSQLGCAVNHISEDVRTDALNLLGIMLDSVPSLLISRPYSLLLNFLHMISTCKESSHCSQRRRVLATNLGRRFTSVEWWARVLFRLEQFLKISLKAWCTEKGNLSQSKCCIPVGQSGGVALYKTSLVPPFSLYSPLVVSAPRCQESAREFSMELVHLLLDMWTEANPVNPSGQRLERGAVALMHSILKVLLLLIEWLKKESSANVKWFEDTFGQLLASHFASRFPYSQDSIHSVVKPFDREVSATTLNLNVCQVLATQRRVVPSNQCTLILQYLRNLLSHEGHIRPGDVKSVLQVSQLLLPFVSPKERLSLVESVLNVYCGDVVLLHKGDAVLIVDFFYRLLLKSAQPPCPVLNAFLRALPQRALDLMSGPVESGIDILPLLCKVALLRLPQFQEGFKTCSLRYVDALQCFLEDSHQRRIIQVLCHTAELDEVHMQRLIRITPHLTHRNLLYLLQLLLARCAVDKDSWPTSLANYYSFFLSVATGMSGMDTALLETWVEHSPFPPLKELLPELSTTQVVFQDLANVAKHAPVIEMVLVSLAMFPIRADLEWVVLPFLDQFFKSYQVIPCTAAVFLLKLVGQRASSLQTSFGGLLLAVAASALCGVAHIQDHQESRQLVLEAIKEYLARCHCTPAIVNMLLQAMQLPLSTECLSVLACSLHLLLQQGLLGACEKALALEGLTAIKVQEDVQYQRWYCNVMYDFAEQATVTT